MELPTRLHGIWNAADFADVAISIGTPSTIFFETYGEDFPSEIVLRCFGAISLQLHSFEMKSDDNEKHLVQIRSVQEPDGIILVRRFEPDTEAPFVISESTPPHNIAPHGDISYVLDRVTS